MKTRHSLAFISTLIVAIAISLTACTRTRSDADITGDVLTRVHADAALAASPISVQTNNGVVVLTGAVETETARAAAENAARQVQGVKGVVNNVQVVSAAVTPPPEIAKPSAQTSDQPPAKPKPAVKKAKSTQPAASAATPSQAAQAPVAPAPQPQAPAAPTKVTIPQGTDIAIRLIDPVDTEKNKEGDTFRASLDLPIMIEDKTVIPKGADVEARLVSAKSAGRFAGSSQIVLVLTKITVGKTAYAVETGQFTKQGGSRGTRTAIVIGGGAAAGAVIGGITGGKKGAAIGAAAGAGAGTGVQALTKGEQIKLPAETLLEFQLKAPLTVTPHYADVATREKIG